MLINGIDRHFKMTVGASCELADLCPQGDLGRLTEVIESSYKNSVTVAAKLILILNKAYEQAQKFKGEEYNEPLTLDEILAMTPDEFQAAQAEAIGEFGEGSKSTVEVKPSKKNKAVE